MQFLSVVSRHCLSYFLETSRCSKLLPIWEFLDKIMQVLGFTFSFTASREWGRYDLINENLVKNEEVLIIYLNTITNYKIWKCSMKIQYEHCTFNLKSFVTSFGKTVEGRKKIELSDRIKHCQRIEGLENLSNAVKIAVSAFLGGS